MHRQQTFQNNKSTLFVVSTPIGNLHEVSNRVIETLNNVACVFCEDTRVTGKLLSTLNIKKPLFSAYENIEKQSSEKVLEYLKDGKDVALCSDAGYPGVSDPGSIIIKEVINNGFNVTVVNGPSALLSSVVASGMPTDHFYFYGFLSPKESQRIKELEELKYFKDTIIFYQSPHKVEGCLTDMLNVLGDRNICLCRELTKMYEEYIRGTISEILPIIDTLKGEMVVVVEGYKEENKSNVSLEDCLPLVKKEIEKGLSTKEAIKIVAINTNNSKKELYQYYHDIVKGD